MPITTDYVTVTEVPGIQVTREAWSMMWARYGFAERFCEGKDVLEVGCGAGQGLGFLARRAHRVVGGDYSEELVRVGHHHYAGRIPLVRFDAQALPFRDRCFDVVILFEAIYYLAAPGVFLGECRRVLRDKGVVLVCSVNREWPDFNPSPYSTRYLSLDEIAGLLEEMEFSTSLFAGFPAATETFREKMVSAVKRTAVALHLMPRTMKGKQFLKRLFFGRLVSLPPELAGAMPETDVPRQVSRGQAVQDFKIIYAAGETQGR
jgi:SAM-dependent methyltransferase